MCSSIGVTCNCFTQTMNQRLVIVLGNDLIGHLDDTPFLNSAVYQAKLRNDPTSPIDIFTIFHNQYVEDDVLDRDSVVKFVELMNLKCWNSYLLEYYSDATLFAIISFYDYMQIDNSYLHGYAIDEINRRYVLINGSSEVDEDGENDTETFVGTLPNVKLTYKRKPIDFELDGQKLKGNRWYIMCLKSALMKVCDINLYSTDLTDIAMFVKRKDLDTVFEPLEITVFFNSTVTLSDVRDFVHIINHDLDLPNHSSETSMYMCYCFLDYCCFDTDPLVEKMKMELMHREYIKMNRKKRRDEIENRKTVSNEPYMRRYY